MAYNLNNLKNHDGFVVSEFISRSVMYFTMFQRKLIVAIHR